jgi:SWIM zinc finger
MNRPAALTAACSMVGMPVSLPFTEADIKLAAGARSFERGLGYLGAVGDLEISDTEVTASVYGTSEYSVRLVFGDQGLSGSCTCPYGRDGFFCKHCVAVGLSVLEMGEDLTWHIEATRAERQAPPRGEYLDYDGAYRYANEVCKAAMAIDDLIQAGGAADAIAIAREAIGSLTGPYEFVDDSSGSVADAAYELLAVHLRACEAAPPEPVSLGGYLAGLMLDNGCELYPDLDEYAELLGDEGAAVVRQRIVTAYAENPASRRAKWPRPSRRAARRWRSGRRLGRREGRRQRTTVAAAR